MVLETLPESVPAILSVPFNLIVPLLVTDVVPVILKPAKSRVAPELTTILDALELTVRIGLYVVPDGMVTTELAVGTAPVDQLVAVDQLVEVPPVQIALVLEAV